MPSKQTAAGAWSVHPIEHVISAYYDITHGVGLAVLTPAWMSYVLSDMTAPRFARFAREVFGVEEADNRKAAELGIQKVRAFNQSLEMPATLSEAGVPEDLFDEMASEAVRTSTFDLDVMEEKNNMKCEIERMEINYTFYFCLFEKSDKIRLA